jgi:AcrR family transcriptional regulator
MDALAHELGMSKKTLYVHFDGKESILAAVFDDLGRALRGEMDTVLSQTAASFAEKLCGVVTVAGAYVGKTSPTLLRELQRYAPRHYARLEELRREHIPQIFGRLIRDGIASGSVRPEFDAAFAAEFWSHAIRGLMQPEVLERTGLSPRQTVDRAVHLFFSGLLSPAGRKDYENHRREHPVH